MKIGIPTYHRVINHGSAVQAYCLVSLLAERLPEVRIELIDYPRTSGASGRR